MPFAGNVWTWEMRPGVWLYALYGPGRGFSAGTYASMTAAMLAGCQELRRLEWEEAQAGGTTLRPVVIQQTRNRRPVLLLPAGRDA